MLGQELKQGRNVEAGTDTEAMDKHCLMLAQPPYIPQAHLHSLHLVYPRLTCAGVAPSTMG